MIGPTPEQARALWAAAKASADAAQRYHAFLIYPRYISQPARIGTSEVTAYQSREGWTWSWMGHEVGEAHRAVGGIISAGLNSLGPWSPEALAAVREG